MNDTPKGDGNTSPSSISSQYTLYEIRMNDTPKGDGIITMIK